MPSQAACFFLSALFTFGQPVRISSNLSPVSGSGSFSSVISTPMTDRMENTNTRHTQFIAMTDGPMDIV